MSWGYFLDLDLTLPTAEWRRLAATRTADHPIAPEWWGFQERGLAEMFGGPDFDGMTIGDAVARFDRPNAIGRVTVAGDETTLRVCDLLDRAGDPSIAKAIAALVEAAKATARGALRLVNDGSYSGEDGIVVRVDRGTLSREAVADCWAITSKLGREIFGAEIFDGGDDDGGDDSGDADDGDESATAVRPRQLALWDEATPSRANAATKVATKDAAKAAKPAKAAKAGKPATAKAGKPAATKPAKAAAKAGKPATAKIAATKPAKAAKPAAKKPAATKPAKAAKPAAKKPAAKKPAANKPAAKKPAATPARNARARRPGAKSVAPKQRRPTKSKR